MTYAARCTGQPADTPGAEAWDCDVTAVGGVCTAYCNEGYGSVSSECEADGVWGPVQGAEICQPCPGLPDPVGDANWFCSGDYYYGRTCYGFCDECYSGYVSSTCTFNGTSMVWDTPFGGCDPLICDKVSGPFLVSVQLVQRNSQSQPHACSSD